MIKQAAILEATISYRATGRAIPDRPLNTPRRVVSYVRDALMANAQQEAIWCILLNRKNHPLGRTMVHLGGRAGLNVDYACVFRAAVIAGATALVMVHNHPSGNPAPSGPDESLTKAVVHIGRLLDVDVIDHVIVSSAHLGGRVPYYSFRTHHPRMFYSYSHDCRS